MAKAFHRKRDRIIGTLDAAERSVVAGLMEQTRELLAPAQASTGDPLADLLAELDRQGGLDPDRHVDAAAGADHDPALDRLLPRAHRGDDAVAAEFRRLTEQDLRTAKSANLDASIAVLRGATSDKVTLTQAQAQAMTMALTDTRLLIGERLGLRSDEDVEALEREASERFAQDQQDPLAYAVAVYDFLTWMQECVTQALIRGL